MKRNAAIVVLGSAAVCMAASVTSAGASGLPTPAECSFHRGVETCTSTAEDTVIIGPFTTDGYVYTTTTFGGVTGEQICLSFYGEDTPFRNALLLSNALLTVETATTTTTRRHGVHGHVFSIATSTSTRVVTVSGIVGCAD